MNASPPNAVVRRRRTREEVEALLRESAQQVFAEVGFHRATTREIATRSGVSETLLFRYFGDKNGIFEAVVAGPFKALAKEFSRTAHNQYSAAKSHMFTGETYTLALNNRDLLRAYLHYAMTPDGQSDGLRAFDEYFAAAASNLRMHYAQTGHVPTFDIDIAVRAGFSMIVTAVVAAPWLFENVKSENVKTTLGEMVFKVFAPATNIDD